MEKDFLDPQKVLDQLDLAPNMVGADFGSGSGGWAIPLAEKLTEGKVFAIDILKEPLSALEGKMRSKRILNIQTIFSNVEQKGGSKISDSSVDLVLMTNLLFQVENRKAVFQEAKKILKKGGKILIVDWFLNTPFGPEKGRIQPETVKKLAKEIGLSFEKEIKAGVYHYGIILEKP